MKRKPFCYSEFVRNWREKCAELHLNPDDGSPLAFAWPEERRQPDGRAWWVDSAIFEDPGPAHSSTEREAIANIAAKTRAMTGAPKPDTLAEAMDREFRAIVRDALAEDNALTPLRERMAAQGKTIETDKYGIRREVAIGAVA